MPPKWSAIHDRLERADEQLAALGDMVQEYFRSDRCRYRGHYDAHTSESKIAHDIEFPSSRLYTSVGEVVHNMRSSLDHLAYELVLASQGTPDDQTCWPILRVGPTPSKQGIRPKPSVSGGVSQDAAALIERWQPYRLDRNNEHDALWLLHRLSVIDKHRHVPIKGIAARITWGVGDPNPEFNWTSEFVKATEHEAELRLVPDDPSVDAQGSATLHIVVSEPPGSEPSLMSTLRDAREAIRRIMDEAVELPEIANGA